MGRAHTLTLSFAFALMAMDARAQGGADGRVHAGDQWFKQMAYAMAIPEYKAAADMGAVNEHVSKRLAECYRRTGDTENAEHWYAQAVKFLNREPADIYHYAQVLKSNGKYEAAQEQMDRYLQLVRPEGEPRRSNIIDYAKKFGLGMDRFTVRAVGINTPDIEMAAAWAGSRQVIFSSSRNRTTGVHRVAAWDGQPFLDLFIAERGPNGDLSDARELPGDVNSKLHEGPLTVASDQRQLWFTRNNRQRSQSGVNRLSILHATLMGDEWRTDRGFTLNNSEISVAHPALSPDGAWMVFTSDMPGGNGGTDLYRCKREGDQWGEPENLGPEVNTPGNEAYAFVAADGTLWFASDGHPGLGGMDVYAAPRDADGRWSVVINAEAPVNSPSDDFGFILDTDGKTGYFTSDRPGGKGRDDIYAFEMNRPLEQRYLCTGFVIDDENESPLIDVEVKLFDANGQLLGSTFTDAKGTYTFAVEKDREYQVSATMKGRFEGRQFLNTSLQDQEQIIVRDLHLLPDAGVYLRGVVRPKGNAGYISGMTVSVVNLASFFTETKSTGEGGDFNFRLTPNEEYEVLFELPGWFSMSVPVSTVGVKQGVVDLNTAHELEFEPMRVGHALQLSRIRWSQAGATLDPAAKAELDALADLMQLNAAVSFEIGVHSDARGDEDLALALTRQRAEAIMAYLKARGVPLARMTAKGYGATRPVNQCVPGVQCTEEQHAQNRRNEITITSIAQ